MAFIMIPSPKVYSHSKILVICLVPVHTVICVFIIIHWVVLSDEARAGLWFILLLELPCLCVRDKISIASYSFNDDQLTKIIIHVRCRYHDEKILILIRCSHPDEYHHHQHY